MKAMILAAGLGTRLKPWTDHHPKALAMVNGKSLLQRNIEYLQQYGVTDIIVNVHHFADQIIDAIDENNGWGSRVSISDESGEVLETGGGLKKASAFFRQSADPFILMNADILTDLNLFEMIEYHRNSEALASLAIMKRESSRYLLFEENMKLCGWKNDKTGELKGEEGTPYAFSGIHLLSPELLPKIPFEGKFSMIDVYLHLCLNHKILGFEHTGGLLLDVGKPESLNKAGKLFP